MTRRTLRSRIVVGLVAYTLLLTALSVVSGGILNSREEYLIQHSLLSTELDRYVQERARDPSEPPPRSGTLRTYFGTPGRADASIPAPLRTLPPGLHDEINVAGRSVTALVRDVGAQRIVMTFDLTQQEKEERSQLALAVVCLALALAIVLWAIWWLSGRLLRPVSDLADAIDGVEPERRDQRLAVDEHAVREVATIINALNSYLERMDGFMVREGAFIENVSHELRTPVAVISGAAEIMASDMLVTGASRRALVRIQHTTQDMGQLISALLVLAKSPGRLKSGEETCRLEDLVPEIVAEHEHLSEGREIRVSTGPLVPSPVYVTAQIARVAVANVLRNAIENTEHGTVTVWIKPAGVVRIQDSGRGMAPEEVARVYAASARHPGLVPARGIGLQLIRHICDHLGWGLDISSMEQGGTLVVLDMSVSLIEI